MMNWRERVYHRPDTDVVGPVAVNCPRCSTPLGYALRITLETAHNASRRPSLPEAIIACPHCRKSFVAGLWLSIAAYAVDGRAA
jgi:hypothetical protein